MDTEVNVDMTNVDIALNLYKEYTDTDYVYYKEWDTIIIFKVKGELKCLSEIEPKKYFSDDMQIVLMFLINDPYKLVSSTGKYKIGEQISSYCYLTIKDAYTLYQQYLYIEEKYKHCEFQNECKGNDLAHGVTHSWYYNGTLKIEANYVKGKAEGLMRKWYENGKINYEYYYKNNKLHGSCTRWNEHGEKTCDATYKNGIVQSRTTYTPPF